MTQLINFPTRGDHMLDLTFTNDENLFTGLESLPPLGNSDHCIINFSLRIVCQKIRNVLVKNYRKADFSVINNEISIYDFSFLDNETSATQKWEEFFDYITRTIERYIPLSSISKDSTQPWITYDLKKLHRKVKRLKSKAHKSVNKLELKQISFIS